MSQDQPTDAQWWAKGFATIKSRFAEVLRDGPPPKISAADEARLRALAQPWDYFGAIRSGTLAESLRDAPRITETEREWIQKHYAAALLKDLRRVKFAVHAVISRSVQMAAVPEPLSALVRAAFELGADLERYHALMYQLSHAVRGAKNLVSAKEAARTKGEKARRESRAHAWLQEVQARGGRSAESVYARIERRELLQAGTVKKAIIRLRHRASHQ